MENRLVTNEDLKKSTELHRTYEQAQAALEKAQPRLDELQTKCELARAQYRGACDCPGTQPERTAALTRLCEKLEAERDVVIKAAEKPFQEAREALSRFNGRFTSAASSWLCSIRSAHDYDKELAAFISETLRRMEQLQKQRCLLEEIARCFENAREKIESWKLAEPPKNVWGHGRVYPSTMQIPRLSDWLSH
jgi:hypothetical protein